MRYVCLLGMAQLLKAGIQIGHPHPHFLFHIDFLLIVCSLYIYSNHGKPRFANA